MSEKAKSNNSKLVPGVGRIPFPAYNGKDPYIFISYAHLDHEEVFARIKEFHDQGYNIWYDEGIAPGNEWTAEIAKALKDCSLFVVMVTPRSVASGNCKNEINFAIARKKPFIAIHLEPTVLPDDLELQIGTKQAILLYNMTHEEYVYKYTNAFERFGISRNVRARTASDTEGVQEDASAAGLSKTGMSANKKLLIPALGLVTAALIAAGVFMSQKPPAAGTADSQGQESQTVSVTTDTGASDVTEASDQQAGQTEVEYTYDDSKDSEGADDYLYTEKYNGITLDKYAGSDAAVVTIPEVIDGKPVSCIGEACFENHYEIQEVILPDTVTTIRYNAFKGCTSLARMNIPKSLESVGGWAFAQTAITEMVFPDTLKNFEYGAFNSCIKLEKVVLSDKIVYIDKDTFSNCKKIAKVTIPSPDVDINIKAFDEKSTNLTLCGARGSYTEKYAKVMGFAFEEYKK